MAEPPDWLRRHCGKIRTLPLEEGNNVEVMLSAGEPVDVAFLDLATT